MSGRFGSGPGGGPPAPAPHYQPATGQALPSPTPSNGPVQIDFINLTEVINSMRLALQDVKIQQTDAQEAISGLTARFRELGESTGRNELSMRGMCEDFLTERLRVHEEQLKALVGEVKGELAASQQQQRDQINYGLTLESREIRHELIDVKAKLEGCMGMAEEGVELRRSLSDLRSGWEGTSQRLENLGEELIRVKKDGNSGAIRNRLDTVESLAQANRVTLSSALDEVRARVEHCVALPELQRIEGRVEQQAGEVKSLRGTANRLDAQLQDVKCLFTSVQDLNDRITTTIGEFEQNTLSLGGEMGELNGNFQILTAKQQAAEQRVAEAVRARDLEIEDLNRKFTGHTEAEVAKRCAQLESKFASKIGNLEDERQAYRKEHKELLQLFEDKLDDCERTVMRVAETAECSMPEKVKQLQSDMRCLGHRVDQAVSDRGETSAKMKRQLTQTIEITQGLQSQYDSMAHQQLSNQEEWVEAQRELRGRVEKCEQQSSHWGAQLECSLLQLNGQVDSLFDQRMSDTRNSMISTHRDIKKLFTILPRLDADVTSMKEITGRWDSELSAELDQMRQLHGQSQQEILSIKTRLDEAKEEMKGHNTRQASALLDVDTHVSQSVGDLRALLSKADGELQRVANRLDGFEVASDTRLTQSEQRLNSLVAEIKSRADPSHPANASMGPSREIDAALGQVKDRLQTTESSLRASLSEAKLQSQESYTVLQSLSGVVSNFENALKKMDGQINHLLRSQKDLTSNQDESSQQLVELKSEFGSISTNFANITSRLETVLSRPLATEQAVKTMQTALKDEITRVAKEGQQTTTDLQESQERGALESSSKVKALAHAMLEFRNKLDTLETNQRDQEASLSTALDDLRNSSTEAAEHHTRRQDAFSKDLQGAKATLNKLEVEGRELRGLGASFETLSSSANTSIERLQTSTDTITNTLSQLSARVDRQDQVGRESLAELRRKVVDDMDPRVTDIGEKLDQRVGHWESKFTGESEMVRGSLSQIRRETEDFRKAMQAVVQRQEAVDRLHQFGVKATNQLRDELAAFETDQGRKLDSVRGDLDRHIREMTQQYETRLKGILDRESTQAEIREMTSRLAMDLKSELTELRQRANEDIGGLISLFGLTRGEVQAANVAPNLDQRVKLLHKKPAFSGLVRAVEQTQAQLNSIGRLGTQA